VTYIDADSASQDDLLKPGEGNMIRRWMAFAGSVMVAAACAGTPESDTDMGGDADVAASAGAATTQAARACEPVERMPLEGRASPYDSTLVSLGGAQAKICYGRPSVKGRTVFGGLVPYDTLWRTGANEPTIIHLPVAAEIADIDVPAGSYSLYTVPGRESWTVIVNRSTSQWGHEGQYTAAVREQEVGRATVRAERTTAPVERFTIRAEPRGSNAADLVLEWENTRVRIPVERD
jgi:hypothetical protein